MGIALHSPPDVLAPSPFVFLILDYHLKVQLPKPSRPLTRHIRHLCKTQVSKGASSAEMKVSVPN